MTRISEKNKLHINVSVVKEKGPAETGQGTDEEQKGVIIPKPPETLAKMLWLKQNWKKHWPLILVALLVFFACPIVKFLWPKNELLGKKPALTGNSTIEAYVSKDGTILDSSNFPWNISRSKTKEGSIVFVINERYGDSSVLSVHPDNLENTYITYRAIDGLAVKFTCPEETISNFTIRLKQ
ncbi:MAG: hypothetical protein JW720_01175 [Sedimentisphaerales bacterium]|nr:hypothetical protein [Sedimentisphaerales bacterium]